MGFIGRGISIFLCYGQYVGAGSTTIDRIKKAVLNSTLSKLSLGIRSTFLHIRK